jgi:hypothetical protein
MIPYSRLACIAPDVACVHERMMSAQQTPSAEEGVDWCGEGGLHDCLTERSFRLRNTLGSLLLPILQHRHDYSINSLRSALASPLTAWLVHRP